MAGAGLQGYAIPTGSHTNEKLRRKFIFSWSFLFGCQISPWLGMGMDEVNPNGITLQNPQETVIQDLADFSI